MNGKKLKVKTVPYRDVTVDVIPRTVISCCHYNVGAIKIVKGISF